MASPTHTSIADALTALGLQEARWQAVLDSAQDAIISIDQRGLVTLFNRAAERMLGYSANEVIGHNLIMLMPAPYRDEHAEYVAQYERTGMPQAIGRIRDVQALRKNGEVFPIELSVSEARYGNDRIYTAILRDVSERARAQADLHEAQHLTQQRERLADIGAITAQVVHDLKNPLAAISMQTQLLARRIAKGSSTGELLPTVNSVLTAIHRLDETLREFMTFTREQRLDVADVSIPQLLRALRDLWFPLASSREIELILDVPQGELSLRADGQKLSRLIENLVKNAVEAIDRGPGCVTIAAAPLSSAERIRISVADTGPGVVPNRDIFELFETTKRNGTGLGLAIAKQIVVAHGGNIQFEPRTPHGTVFYVDLPAAAVV
jgi:two-component system sensor kinase FixL